MATHTVQIALRLSPLLRDKLAQLAAAEGRSLNREAVRAIEHHLATSGRTAHTTGGTT